MIPVYSPFLDDQVRRYVLDCLDSGWISSLGKYVGEFETAFARFCGAPYGVATSSGTSALHLALVVLGIGHADEVLLPSLTFVATANAVRYVGAQPVFVEADPATWCMDPADVRRRITPRTRAVIAVHLYGHPVDMDPLLAMAHEHGLRIVEDAAEAHGARYRGRQVGALGDVGCFSFYGNKIVTTGEGGMLVTMDAAVAERARLLRDHAMDPKRRYWHPEVGFNYRMTNIQAAIGCAQMERIDEILASKRRIARQYADQLREVSGLTLAPCAPWAESVYWMYSVLVEDGFGMTRDQVMAELRTHGIDTRPFFVPMHRLPPYRSSVPLPVSDRLAARGINLPSGSGLTEEEVRTVTAALRGMSGARGKQR
jgi:perosamine synthetase